MLSINFRKGVIVVTALLFLWCSACATMGDSSSSTTYQRPEIKPYHVTVPPDPEKPYASIPLKAGAQAPTDGVFFKNEDANRLLQEVAQFRGMKQEVLVQNQTVDLYVDQIGLLRDANDYQAQANRQLRDHIEKKEFWDKVKNWVSVAIGIAAFSIGTWASK